ncbi:MAG TPA: TMEM14 family protein [Candidatus Obscuribacter sp.]|nr:TMEM14 family protein [Candidatus Obscuribacter sp.]HMW90315.1 TMEM14 family protein [Candidatus Obscuribacter sp.]HNA73100.1 TMEM14 family protein [Candidatus Obscuribacter sp.]HNG76394.1 TMEM14 family protein [Candidatus Obscuribacter sp.]HNM50745.1 TMEM14 family protein [Candidatus Obscuribacter sp.]
MLEVAKISVLALAIIVFAGGIMGFVKAKSKASLISGVISGIALAACFAISLNEIRQGLMGALVVSGLLTVVFIIRYIKTKKLMPAGLMLLCCIGSLGLLAKALFDPN